LTHLLFDILVDCRISSRKPMYVLRGNQSLRYTVVSKVPLVIDWTQYLQCCKCWYNLYVFLHTTCTCWSTNYTRSTSRSLEHVYIKCLCC